MRKKILKILGLGFIVSAVFPLAVFAGGSYISYLRSPGNSIFSNPLHISITGVSSAPLQYCTNPKFWQVYIRSQTVSPGNFPGANHAINETVANDFITLPDGDYTRVAIGFTDDLVPVFDGDGNLQDLCDGIDVEGLNDDSQVIFSISSTSGRSAIAIAPSFRSAFSATVSDTFAGVGFLGLLVIFMALTSMWWVMAKLVDMLPKDKLIGKGYDKEGKAFYVVERGNKKRRDYIK